MLKELSPINNPTQVMQGWTNKNLCPLGILKPAFKDTVY